RLRFVLVAKPTSHPALFAQVAAREQRGECQRGTWTEGTGPRPCTFAYRSVTDVPLTQAGAVRVNFLEVWEQHPDGTVGYHNSWVTDSVGDGGTRTSFAAVLLRLAQSDLSPAPPTWTPAVQFPTSVQTPPPWQGSYSHSVAHALPTNTKTSAPTKMTTPSNSTQFP